MSAQVVAKVKWSGTINILEQPIIHIEVVEDAGRLVVSVQVGEINGTLFPD